VLVTLVAIGIAVAIVLVLINFKENCNNNSFYFIDDCNNNTSISNPYTGQLSCKIGTKGVKVATIYQKTCTGSLMMCYNPRNLNAGNFGGMFETSYDNTTVSSLYNIENPFTNSTSCPIAYTPLITTLSYQINSTLFNYEINSTLFNYTINYCYNNKPENSICKFFITNSSDVESTRCTTGYTPKIIAIGLDCNLNSIYFNYCFVNEEIVS